MTTPRQCPCGITFTPPAKHPHQAHCSRRCSNKANSALPRKPQLQRRSGVEAHAGGIGGHFCRAVSAAVRLWELEGRLA
ncbi:MAG TPA: hypothetical protein VMQ76_13285 [Terracidiphilus sp.]|nr:hypothetical protein [Terracidiphilus sp.]